MHKYIQTILAILFLSVFAATAFAQSKADEIVGIWWNQEKDANVQVYKSGNTYAGKIIWLKTPNDPETHKPKLDKDNPDAKLRSQPLVGLRLMYGFTYDADEKEWSGGSIYDARSGKTYKCFLSFNPDKTLKVRGYIGASWMGLGKTNTWTRKN
jgi:uncharacterized protein (DUF2147 family)